MYNCARSAITFNNLNLPTYDIHSKESRQQILVNFHTLAQSFIDISNKHIDKSRQQNERISKLRDRILNCKDKISQLQSTNQALVFVSPGEYPRKYKFDPQKNVSIFQEYLLKTKINKLDMQAHYQVKHEMAKLGQQSKLQLAQLNNFVGFLLGQLQGRKKSIFQKSLLQNPSSKHQQQSIGSIPSSIQYIDSLVVFNQCSNPYRKYELTGTAQRPNPKTSNSLKANKKQLYDIQKDQILIDRELEDYSKPKFQEGSNKFIPEQKELQLPDFDQDLDLNGIVAYDFMSDLTNGGSDMVGLMPVANVVPDSAYKNVAASASTGLVNKSQQSASTGNLPAPPSLPNSNSNQPPSLSSLPPPPPPHTLPSPPSSVLPPPPGLPPPLTMPSMVTPSKLPDPPAPIGRAPAPPAPSSGGGRSALLSQLQNPNPMARLKKTVTIQKGGIKPADAPSTANSFATRSAPASGGTELSFMEALQAKIATRFHALHPKNQSDEEQDDQ